MTTVNITVANDADFYRTFRYQHRETGLPIDLTGGSMVMMLRRRATDEVAVLRLGTDTGEIQIAADPTTGEFTVYISQDTLERLGLGEFAQSAVLTKDGRKNSVWTGLFTNNPGPSR
jgi:hypothetical protein